MSKNTHMHIQRDLSGGEISPSMFMRTDTEVYKRSVWGMVNFLPRPTGSAVRVPGTRWLRDVGNLDARIMPFLTTGNERSLVLLTPTNLKLIRNITDELDTTALTSPVSTSYSALGAEQLATIVFWQQKVSNFSFYRDLEDWTFFPNEYPPVGGGATSLGVYMSPTLDNTAMMVPRLYKYPKKEEDECTLETTCEIDYPSDTVLLDYQINYIMNPPQSAGGYTFRIQISSTSDHASPLYDQSFDQSKYPVGSSFNPGGVTVTLPSAGWTGTLYIKMTATALPDGDIEYSNPHFGVFFFKVFGLQEAELTEADLVTPYTAEDLPDLHYIQSPYGDKELVITHPKHPPHRLRFDTGGGQYVFEAIPFVNQPGNWAVNNYPATCGSYHGRLVLAGSQSFKTASGDPIATVSETVWCTEVTNWNTFTDPLSPEVNPDDSVEFAATYRSPIQWVYGQKTLLVGALEFEYSASGEGVFAPGDLGVFLHSTHGSSNVQPAGFGEFVLFPSDGGTRVRSMRYQQQDEGWVSVDLTVLNPEIVEQGIRRMVRVRTPHQMMWAVTKKGTIAVWNQESGLQGWCRLRQQSGTVQDIAVLSNNEGKDVPFVLVKRRIDGTDKLYLEAYNDLQSQRASVYMESNLVYNFETPTNVITGLDHLEGKKVLVGNQYRYVGYFDVVGGQITMNNPDGSPIQVTNIFVGLQNRCNITTLPPEKLDPGASARYVKIGVRVSGSTRPIIAGERPSDRDTTTLLNFSEGPDIVRDLEIRARGWNPYQPIGIMEQVPFRVEVLGIYGLLSVGDVV